MRAFAEPQHCVKELWMEELSKPISDHVGSAHRAERYHEV